jgi:hypothetical protein
MGARGADLMRCPGARPMSSSQIKASLARRDVVWAVEPSSKGEAMEHGDILAVIGRYAGQVRGYDREQDVYIFSVCGQTQTLTGPFAREGVEGSTEQLVRQIAE